MTRAAAKPVQLAHLRVRYLDLILPADKAMKVAELLQHAVKCEIHFESGHTYHLSEQPEVSFTLVKASQIRARRPEPEERGQAEIIGLPAPRKGLPR